MAAWCLSGVAQQPTLVAFIERSRSGVLRARGPRVMKAGLPRGRRAPSKASVDRCRVVSCGRPTRFDGALQGAVVPCRVARSGRGAPRRFGLHWLLVISRDRLRASGSGCCAVDERLGAGAQRVAVAGGFATVRGHRSWRLAGGLSAVAYRCSGRSNAVKGIRLRSTCTSQVSRGGEEP